MFGKIFENVYMISHDRNEASDVIVVLYLVNIRLPITTYKLRAKEHSKLSVFYDHFIFVNSINKCHNIINIDYSLEQCRCIDRTVDRIQELVF